MARIIVIGGGVGGLDDGDAARTRRQRRDGARAGSGAAARLGRRGVGALGAARRQPVPHDPHVPAALSRAARGGAARTRRASSRALGAIRFNPFELIPAEMTGGFQPGRRALHRADRRAGRSRETALARAAAATPRLEVRRGVAVPRCARRHGDGERCAARRRRAHRRRRGAARRSRRRRGRPPLVAADDARGDRRARLRRRSSRTAASCTTAATSVRPTARSRRSCAACSRRGERCRR